jgi:hypothetical protein
MLDDANPEPLQLGLIADTRLQENLGSVNRTKRQNHLTPRANATGAALVRNLHARGSFALEG